MSTSRVDFTRAAAERIANAVRIVETGDRDGAPLRFGRAIGAGGAVVLHHDQKVFRICTFTGAWGIDTAKTVTFRNVTTTPNTLRATNLFFDIPDDGSKACAVGKDGTAWYLIQWRWAIATCTTAAT